MGLPPGPLQHRLSSLRCIVQRRVPSVERSPIAVRQFSDATAPGIDHGRVGRTWITHRNNRLALRPLPNQTVATDGELAVHVVGGVMVGLYQHAVQIVSTRIGEVVAAVEREVGLILNRLERGGAWERASG